MLADRECPRPSRRYDFNDDFASVTGSDAPPIMRPGDRVSSLACDPLRSTSEYGGISTAANARSSLASSIKNRISLPSRDERRQSRLSFRGRGRRSGAIRPCVEDSILHDWKQASALRQTADLSDDASPAGCAGFLSRFFARDFDADSRDNERAKGMVEDGRRSDVQFVSILAYEEFMHSPNRPSTVAKLLSRLRRS